MPEWLRTSGLEPLAILQRLVSALVLGAAVAWIHARTSRSVEIGASFPATLVLLAVLIAMVTQVIGDNVARAFSLVGALSIVRFRTVVRDTRDTAFVIFAVVVGMAAGAQNFWVGVLGLIVGGGAAFALAALDRNGPEGRPWTPARILRVRAALAVDLEKTVASVLEKQGVPFRLAAMGTTRQSTGIEGSWDLPLQPDLPTEGLVRELLRIDGIQDVRIELREDEEMRR